MIANHLKLKPYTKSWMGFLFFFIIVAVFYIFATKIGFLLATMNKSVSPVWPASAVGIIALYLLGPQAFLSIFLSAFAANAMNHLSPAIAMFIGFGNACEALAGYYLFIFLHEKTKVFEDFSKIITLLAVSIFPPFLSALIGSSTLFFANLIDNNFLEIFITWWVGDSMGILLVLPLVCTYFEKSIEKYDSPDFSTFVVKAWVLFITLFGLSLIFSHQTGTNFVFLVFPILLLSIWTAGIKMTYYISFFISVVGVYLTSKNIGPFSDGSSNINLIRFQFFSAGIILTTLVLEYLVKIKEVKWSSAVLLGSWFLTGFTFYSFHQATIAEKDNNFSSIVEKAEMEIRKNMDQYFRLLESGVGLMEASEEVTSQDWKQFVKALSIKDKYPGLNGIGIVRILSPKNLNGFLEKNKLTLKSPANSDENEINRRKQDHFIITQIEPIDNNKPALGLDLSAEKLRREAALSANTNQNHRSMTKIIRLVQDSQNRPGFLIFTPYYLDGKLSGFVYAPVIFEQFIAASVNDYLKDVNLEVFAIDNFDENNVSSSELIYKTQNTIPSQNKFTSRFSLANNPFTFKWSKTENFTRNNNVLDSIISFIGAVFSLFLALGLATLKNTSKKASELAELKSKQLDETQLQLINAARLSSLGMMASGVAHEINNPLTIISGRARLISKLSDMPNVDMSKLKDYAENIISTVDKVTKVVKSMRLLARDGSKDGFSIVSLDNIINATLDVSREKLKNYNISIKVDPIPQLHIECREVQLGQVLINLINNSFDAITDLKDKWIEIKFETFTEKVRIKIIDSGNGIPPEIAAKLMVPFFTTKEPGKGTGLGLSISRSIISDHHGSLEIDDKNKNTCFVIELPLYQPVERTQSA